MIDLYTLLDRVRQVDKELGQRLVKFIASDERRYNTLAKKTSNRTAKVGVNMLIDTVQGYNVCREEDIEKLRSIE